MRRAENTGQRTLSYLLTLGYLLTYPWLLRQLHRVAFTPWTGPWLRTDPMGITDSDEPPFQPPVSPPERIIECEQSLTPPAPAS